MRVELNLKQNTKEWLRSREKKFTGSNAILLLTGDYQAALEANSKTFNGNFWTQRGHILEDEAVEIYNAIYNMKLKRAGVVTDTRWPNAQCSPDGEDEDRDALIEVKCLKIENHIRESKSPSAKYVAQSNFNALICGRKKAIMIFYCPDDNLQPEQQFIEVDVTNKAIQANIKRRLKDALQ